MKEERHDIMDVFSGGGYGADREDDGLTNGCSTIGDDRVRRRAIGDQRGFPTVTDGSDSQSS